MNAYPHHIAHHNTPPHHTTTQHTISWCPSGQSEEKLGEDHPPNKGGNAAEGLERGTRGLDSEGSRILQDRIGQIQEQNRVLLNR